MLRHGEKSFITASLLKDAEGSAGEQSSEDPGELLSLFMVNAVQRKVFRNLKFPFFFFLRTEFLNVCTHRT